MPFNPDHALGSLHAHGPGQVHAADLSADYAGKAVPGVEVQAAGGPAFAFPQESEDRADLRSRDWCQGSTIEDQRRTGSGSLRRSQQVSRSVLFAFVGFVRLASKPGQNLDDPRIELLGEKGQQL